MTPDHPPASRRAFLALLGLAGSAVFRQAHPAAQQVSVRSGSLGPLIRTVTLNGVLDHPQGITTSADGATLFVTSVLRKEQKGLLVAFRASDGMLLQRVEVQDGARYHPGGLGRLGDALWLPVAEYRRTSTSVVQCRDVKTLAVRSSFPVADHIGAVAVTSGALIGCNWDARVFYEWTFEGKESKVVEHDGCRAVPGSALDGGGPPRRRPDRRPGRGGPARMALARPARAHRRRQDRPRRRSHGRKGWPCRGTELLLMPEDDPDPGVRAPGQDRRCPRRPSRGRTSRRGRCSAVPCRCSRRTSS